MSSFIRARSIFPLVALVALGLANVLWNWQGDVKPFDLASPTPPLRITRASSSLATDGVTLTVEVDIVNVDSERQTGRVWWQLATTTQPGKIWERRAYESSFRRVDLSADGAATLTWTEQALVPAGPYEVQAWAEVSRRDRFAPSDGMIGVPPVVKIEPSTTGLLRRGPPVGDVVVTSAATRVEALPPAGTGNVVDLRNGSSVAPSFVLRSDVTLESRSREPRSGWLRWSVSGLDGRDLTSWWRSPDSSPPGRYQEIGLQPGQDLVVHLEEQRAMSPGTYLLRVSLDITGSPPANETGDRFEDVLSVLDVSPAAPSSVPRITPAAP